MKLKYTLPLAALAFTINAQAQDWIPDTVSMGVNYQNDVYYSFENGAAATPSNTNWHLAIEAISLAGGPGVSNPHGGVGIWINEASKGEKVKLYSLHEQGTASFLTAMGADTIGKTFDSLALHNSPVTYADGAFNANATGGNDPSVGIDYGWGWYSASAQGEYPAHSVVGDSLFLLTTLTGGGMGQPATQTGAYFVWPRAVVNGTEWTIYIRPVGSDNVDTLQVSTANSNQIFVYYNLNDGFINDRAPLKSGWDINFTNYEDNYSGPETGGMSSIQGVSGVLSNYNVTVAQMNNTLPNDADISTITNNDYSEDINTIGYDWKVVNMQTFTYDLKDSLSWFVKVGNGDIWQIYFDQFYTDSTTNERMIGLEKRKVFDHTTAVNNINQNINNIVLAPNPSENGATNILVDAKKALPNTQIIISDITGRIVFKTTTDIPSGFQRLPLNVSNFTSGLYIVNLMGNDWKSTQKLVIQ